MVYRPNNIQRKGSELMSDSQRVHWRLIESLEITELASNTPPNLGLVVVASNAG